MTAINNKILFLQCRLYVFTKFNIENLKKILTLLYYLYLMYTTILNSIRVSVSKSVLLILYVLQRTKKKLKI